MQIDKNIATRVLLVNEAAKDELELRGSHQIPYGVDPAGLRNFLRPGKSTQSHLIKHLARLIHLSPLHDICLN